MIYVPDEIRKILNQHKDGNLNTGDYPYSAQAALDKLVEFVRYHDCLSSIPQANQIAAGNDEAAKARAEEEFLSELSKLYGSKPSEFLELLGSYHQFIEATGRTASCQTSNAETVGSYDPIAKKWVGHDPRVSQAVYMQTRETVQDVVDRRKMDPVAGPRLGNYNPATRQWEDIPGTEQSAEHMATDDAETVGSYNPITKKWESTNAAVSQAEYMTKRRTVQDIVDAEKRKTGEPAQ